MRKLHRQPLWLILLLYLILGILYAVNTPPWQAPDEPAHYNYIRQLAEGSFPVMEAGDYNQAYITTVVFESNFDPDYAITPLTYEDWQPPLYYLLLTPVYWLTSGSLLALRLMSVLLGAGVVTLAYAIGRRLFPEQRWVATGTAVFVAFLPQHLAILAAVNNDALAELLIALALWQLLALERWRVAEDKRPYLLLGLTLGLGLVTKGTVYPLAAVVGLALLWRHWGKWGQLLQAGWWVFFPALLVGALWWGRNLLVYGGWDLLGKAAHDAVVVGQPRTADLIARIGWVATARMFVQTTFHSFWGQFGWMVLPMNNPSWLYPLLWLVSGAVLAGLVWQQVMRLSSPTSGEVKNPAISRMQVGVLLAVFGFTLGVHVTYNATFIQHQGRYLFPALVPIGIGVMLGLSVWWRPLFGRWIKNSAWLPVGIGAAMIALDLWALFRIIVPNLG